MFSVKIEIIQIQHWRTNKKKPENLTEKLQNWNQNSR